MGNAKNEKAASGLKGKPEEWGVWKPRKENVFRKKEWSGVWNVADRSNKMRPGNKSWS